MTDRTDESEDLPEKKEITPVKTQAHADPHQPYLQSLTHQWSMGKQDS